MSGNASKSRQELEEEIEQLKVENHQLKQRVDVSQDTRTVTVPDAYRTIFNQAQVTVSNYFQNLSFNPNQGLIEVDNERYILVRAASISCDFFKHLQSLYTDRDAQTAFQTGQNFLFDIGHVLGIKDGDCFHKKMNLQNPLEKLSAGPIHFAYTGWGYVHILPQSNPVPNDSFFLKYHHPYSFEADAWLSQGLKAEDHVCIMNAAYSSGWCEASYGIPLTAIEIACRARGDQNCTFIMAPPHKINEYLDTEASGESQNDHNTPLFFNRKASEEKIKASLKEKELMLQEIHHRVKNNLQIIVALMSLQLKGMNNPETHEAMLYTQRRISSIALIHEMLYQSQDFSRIDYQDYLKRMSQELIHSMADQNICIDISIHAENIYLGIDTAIPLGLILNELITNAIKHAFKPLKRGNIMIEIKPPDQHPYYSLIFKDNGMGLPQGFQIKDATSLGLKLIQNLLLQIQGNMQIMPIAQGTHFQIQFYASHVRRHL